MHLTGSKVFLSIGSKTYILAIFMKHYFAFIMPIGQNKLASYANWPNCECENILCTPNIDTNCWL